MRVEITITREKAKAMPKGSINALTEELTRRLSSKYANVEVIVKTASNDSLSVLRSADKEGDKDFVEGVLQDTWESADDWFSK
ncbi:DinI-like family protein [Kosakonia sp. S42]|uniref:DinI-like family protein n=1 Tax=Kosakonia sp. S42 TaxID=2767458 RepID=UPI00190CF591|nr:DinI-like family protein [Kosakonia sp. S42]MBK0018886.1 DinI-like family protein [Kosakonia sp. S42]